MAETASSIKNFSDFGIKTKMSFEGPKLYPPDILDRVITVHYYEIRLSKNNDGTYCLHAQIEMDGVKHLMFSSSTFLMDDIKKVPSDGFPFKVKIVKVNRHFEFRGV